MPRAGFLGVPAAGKDGRTFRLDLGETRAERLTDLQALAGGRRLDAPGDATGKPRHRDSLAVAQPPAPLPAASVDPGKPGSYRTVSGEYDLDPVSLPGFPALVEMRAEVVAPKGATGASSSSTRKVSRRRAGRR